MEIFKKMGQLSLKVPNLTMEQISCLLEKTTLKIYAFNISLYSTAFDLKNWKPYLNFFYPGIKLVLLIIYPFVSGKSTFLFWI